MKISSVRWCALLLAVWLLSPSAVAQADDLETDFARWCQERQAWLVKPDGYLSLVSLSWLTPEPQDLEGVGTVWLEGSEVVMELLEGYTRDGLPVRSVRLDAEQAKTARFYRGEQHFSVSFHGSRVNLRRKDPHSSRLRDFGGVRRYDFDPAWRLRAQLESAPAVIPVTSVVEEVLSESSPGFAVFSWQGQRYRLRLMGEVGDEDYFLVFSDATAGQTTYPACRFLTVTRAPQGELWLDFNRAWNPPCSMTPYATCPLPPEGNVLPFAVEAGELYP